MEQVQALNIPRPDLVREHVVVSLSFAAWCLSALNTATTYLFFQDQPKNGTAISILSSCAMVLLAVLVPMIFGSPIKLEWPKPATWMFVYTGFTGLSLFWTQASSLSNAAGYWVGFAADLLIVIILLGCEDVDTVALAAIKGFVVGSLVVAAIAWTAPGTPDLRMGQEDYLHPNALGYQFAVAALLAIYLALRYRTANYWKWIAAGLDFSLIRTLSKSSIISFSFAAGVYTLFHSSLRWGTKLKIVVVHIVLILLSWPFVSSYLQEYTETRALETLTGRTTIWASSWEIAVEKPWIGHGFYSYRSVAPFFGEFEAWQAHNDLLQQFFSYGIIGVFLAGIVYLSFLRHLRRCQPSSALSLAYAVFVFGLIHGLTEANHIDLAVPVRLMVLLAVWCKASSLGLGWPTREL
jgi:exopolysaccharide production protein ExoQ